jgi:hypothetical protein
MELVVLFHGVLRERSGSLARRHWAPKNKLNAIAASSEARWFGAVSGILASLSEVLPCRLNQLAVFDIPDRAGLGSTRPSGKIAD